MALKRPPVLRSERSINQLAEVADVDELDRPLGRARDEDFAAAGDPVGPVREAPGRVVRTDDEPGADERMAARESSPRPRARRATFSAP